jgi:hypothetical protein
MKKSTVLALLASVTLLVSGVISTGATTISTANAAQTNTSQVDQLLTKNRLQSTKVLVYIDPAVPTGIQQDIQFAVKDWQQATNKLTFSTTNNPGIATLRFTSGSFTNFANGMIFFNQTVQDGAYTDIVNAVIKISSDLVNSDEMTNFGVRVVEHEMGHAFGLGDVTDPSMKNSTVMWWKDPNTGITGLDIKAINSIY